MNDDGSSHIYIKARDQLRWYCIGFTKLTVRPDEEDVRCGGSGTLIEVSGNKCILTAAHVIEDLRAHNGEIGILRFFPNVRRLQTLKLNIGHVRVVSVGNAPFGPHGPDLALLFLPQDTASALASTHSFYNLSARSATAVRKGPYFECIAGVVDERTQQMDLPALKNARRSISLEASFEPGTTQALEPNGNFDLLSFTPQVDAGYTPPKSYEGVSGAALWRVYLELDGRKPKEVRELWLHGVAFYQSDENAGARTITCHGPISIFRLPSNLA